jgi:hypothetical protein
MPQRCVNTLGRDIERQVPMHEPEYSDLARYRTTTEAILTAAGGLMASNQPVVYFVQAGEDGPVKIGFSSKFSGVRSRIDSIQTGCPWPLVVRRIIPVNGVSSERRLHDEFAQYRLSGEWFDPAGPVAEAAGVAPTPTPLRELLDLAWERGRHAGIIESFQEDVTRIAADLREVVDAWEKRHAPEADERWEKRRRDDISALLERRAA